MNETQRQLARHALGLPNRENVTYRNHFCVSPGNDGHSEWMDLVSKGLAIRRISKLFGGDDMFMLTIEGARAVLKPNEQLDPDDQLRMVRLTS